MILARLLYCLNDHKMVAFRILVIQFFRRPPSPPLPLSPSPLMCASGPK